MKRKYRSDKTNVHLLFALATLADMLNDELEAILLLKQALQEEPAGAVYRVHFTDCIEKIL